MCEIRDNYSINRFIFNSLFNSELTQIQSAIPNCIMTLK